jgi:hypothetical protein
LRVSGCALGVRHAVDYAGKPVDITNVSSAGGDGEEV